MMTGRLGASEINMLIKKLRMAKYTKDAAIFLEIQLYNMEKNLVGSLESHGFIRGQVAPAQGFPEFSDHCGGSAGLPTGYGGTTGPSANNIKEIFIASMENVKLFAFKFEGSLGGTVVAFDYTFNIASRIKGLVTSGEATKPIGALFSGALYYNFYYEI